ncbi:MAG: diguanylate cyclase [Candidatus Competibacteraceae bacterium]|nr:diguanylate cyclase [Candidatus Competibacteraceae bacterium]
MNTERDRDWALLRERAEALLDDSRLGVSTLSTIEIERLIHDLSVHQIELELQNEELRTTQNQLEQTRDRYARLYHQAPVGYLTLDASGIIRQTNQTFASMVGRGRGELAGRALADFLADPEHDVFLGRFSAFFKNPEGKSIDVTLCNKDTHKFAARLTGRKDADALLLPRRELVPSMTLLLVIVQDISQQKAMEDALRESEERFRGYYELGLIGMGITALDKTWMQFNDRLCEILGHPRAELATTTWAEITHPDDLAAEIAQFNRVLAGKTDGYTLDKRFIRRDSQTVHTIISVRCVHSPSGSPDYLVVIVQDITERKALELELRRLATTDPLTDLANRRHFLAQVELELELLQRYAKPAALLMIDLDHFKQVNDSYGHAAGDAVLRHFATVARHVLRKVDLLGRLGGEEFAALLPGTDPEGARQLAERLRQIIASSPVHTASGIITITVSIGVTLFALSDSAADTVLARADRALYRAKDEGRNRVEVDIPELPLLPL